MLQRIASAGKRHCKTLLAFLGISTVFDLIKEYVRAALMEWTVGHLGGLGRWLFANPFALLTVTTSSILVVLVLTAIKDSLTILKTR